MMFVLPGTQDYVYLYVTEKRSWNEALQICENYGGTLARITSQEVEDSFYEFFNNGGVWEGHPLVCLFVDLNPFKSLDSFVLANQMSIFHLRGS